MSAARKPTPPPDMGGLKDDWAKLADMRRETMNDQATEPEPPSSDVTTPRAHDVTEPTPRPARRRRPARRPAPRVANAVALTVRFDPDEVPQIDALILQLRIETGTRVDKSEVVRELLRMAQDDHSPTRRTLVKRLGK